VTDTPPAVRALAAALVQMADVVDTLTDEQYTQRPGAAGSTVGGHVRHNLDHIDAMLRGFRSGRLNFDQRERGTAVEHNRTEAVAATDRLRAELLAFPWEAARESVLLSALISVDLPAVEVWSTPEREVVFVLSHTVHHNALIAVIARLVGADTPADFGYAPSTIAHLLRS
jgi:uncharacterized damage-inducible protein DinB